MGLEIAYTTDELNMAFPTSADMVSQGDDHFRLLKLVLRNEFYQLYKKTRKYSFEKGNTILAGQMLFYEAESQYYEWQGAYPVGGLVVPAGSTPSTAGGVGSGKWAVGKANGVASAIVMSDTKPSAPTPGLLWLDTTIGILFVYFDDGSSFQWIECYNPAIGIMSGAEVVRFLYQQYAASIGYVLLSGSVESGAVFTQGNSELVWHQATGNVYKCISGFVGGIYTVAAGSNPTADSNLMLVTDSLRNAARLQTTKPQALSGVLVDSPSLPSWCKKVTAVLNGASLSGGALMLFRAIDNTATVITTGYSSVGFNFTPTAVSNAGQTTGFSFASSQSAAGVYSGKAEFLCNGLQDIVASIEMVESSGVTSNKGGGKLTLSNTLSNIRITSSNGTDTFDAGTIYFIFEG